MVVRPRESNLRSIVREVRDTTRFFLNPPVWDDVLTDDLPFGVEANDRFRDALSKSTSYLEFGSGSSTFVAAALGSRFVTVESDPRFLNAVERRCSRIAIERGEFDATGTYLYANIGRTGPWGVPTYRLRTGSTAQRWSRYPLAPWSALGESYRADLILVDGRFRLACALAMMVHQPEGAWTLLLDDYAERPQYSELRDVADLQEMWGRMAVFGPKPGSDPEKVAVYLSRYLTDWR